MQSLTVTSVKSCTTRSGHEHAHAQGYSSQAGQTKSMPPLFVYASYAHWAISIAWMNSAMTCVQLMTTDNWL